jgi:hypothetical protein
MDQGAGISVFQHPQRAIGAFFNIAAMFRLEQAAWSRMRCPFNSALARVSTQAAGPRSPGHGWRV